MPRFFFDVTEDGRTVVDHEDHQFPSAEKAHDEAVRASTELSMDSATTTRSHAVQVAVSDEAHHVICTTNVTFDPGELDL